MRRSRSTVVSLSWESWKLERWLLLPLRLSWCRTTNQFPLPSAVSSCRNNP